jgi:seryl-tRNA synthetase
MTPQELIKSLTASLGEVTKAQINTALIPIHAEIKELKQDVKRIEQKLDSKLADHEERIERLEEHTGLSTPHKN